jgi:CheY-like chemotaxis protein
MLLTSFSQRFCREARLGTYVMHFAASAAEALDLLLGNPAHWLRSCRNINMPSVDGLQLLDEIKQRRPDLPVMIVSRLWRR